MTQKWFYGQSRFWALGLALVAVVALGATVAGAGEKGDGYMGVYMQDLTRDIRAGLELKVDKGVLVSGVEEDSPAAKAGLEDGDVIMEVDGKAVDSPDALRDMIAAMSPGDEVRVLVFRDGDRKSLNVVLGERPDEWSFSFHGDGDHDMGRSFKWLGDDGHRAVTAFLGGPRLGVQAAELNEDLASYFKTDAGKGVLVLDIIDDSIAKEAGVKPGDVIQKVNDEAIGSVDDLRGALQEFEAGDKFTVTVVRKGRTQTLDATMDDQSAKSFWSGSHPRLHIDRLPRVDRDELDAALDELRDEIKNLKKEIKELKDDA